MSDQTVYAEALIGAVARAFYEDEHILLVDTMIRDNPRTLMADRISN